MSDTNEDDFIVKLRGLPWSATTEDISKFLGDDGIKKVHLTLSKEGRPSGEAFVEFDTEDDLNQAETKDKEHMGSRYIEVFKVNRAEMDWVIKRSGTTTYNGNEDGCVRLRGLPFGCSKEEIAQFFTGLEIVPNGITLLTDYSGRSSGEAYVQFMNREVAEQALEKHREKIGHRYIEIFRSSLSEINGAVGYAQRNNQGSHQSRNSGNFGSSSSSRPGPYDRNDRYSNNNNRYSSARGNRSFKGANLSNNSNNQWGSHNHHQNGGGNNLGTRGSPSSYNNSNYNDNNCWGGNPNNRTNNIQNHCIHMRGLPFKASQQDIAEFFRPIIPITIHILTESSGRPSGEADVTFASHEDAVKAMGKDKSHMSHRYIELFLNSSRGQQNNNNASGAPGGRFRR